MFGPVVGLDGVSVHQQALLAGPSVWCEIDERPKRYVDGRVAAKFEPGDWPARGAVRLDNGPVAAVVDRLDDAGVTAIPLVSVGANHVVEPVSMPNRERSIPVSPHSG